MRTLPGDDEALKEQARKTVALLRRIEDEKKGWRNDEEKMKKLNKLGLDYENRWTHQDMIDKINEIIDIINGGQEELQEKQRKGEEGEKIE